MLTSLQINSTKASTLTEQLNQYVVKTKSKLHLTVNHSLAEDEWVELKTFIQNAAPFPFSKLSLQVNLTTLKNGHFLNILQSLNHTKLSNLELIFSSEQVKQHSAEIGAILTASIAPLVSYPVHILEQNATGVPASVSLDQFQDIVISNIQTRHHSHVFDEENPSIARKRTFNPNDVLAKPIRLKTFIAKGGLQKSSLAQYIQLEVQHTETIEQQIVIDERIEEQVNAELQVLQPYSGQLLGLQEFSAPLYRNQVEAVTGNPTLTDSLYRLLKQELFANLPHAIKYLSPEAASYLAQHLPGFVTLNKDNLPHGCLLKQTQEGELVLDYDPYLENEHTNPFTPAELTREISLEPIYTIELKEDDVKRWINDDALFAKICRHHPYQTPRQLINLWIKFGDEGICSFFKALKQSTASQPDLIEFFLDHYLAHLPQWDHLLDDDTFFNTLERISHYDEPKLVCFKKFLKNTGSSRYDLNKTTAAFEVFWNELTLLCNEKKVPITGVSAADWSTPEGGNPVVYMERMLFLLKNARSLDDQLINLDKLSLDNYCAYYAARFEGFKSVSASMLFNYDAEEQDKKPFNINHRLYRVELDSLYNIWAQEQKRYRVYHSPCYDENYYLIDSSDLPSPFNLQRLNAKWATELKDDESHLLPDIYSGLHEVGKKILDDHEQKYKKLLMDMELKDRFDKCRIGLSSLEFTPPHKLYRLEANGDFTLWLDSPVPELTKEAFYTQALRFLGMQTSGITVSSFKSQLAEYQTDNARWDNLTSTVLAALYFCAHERYLGNLQLDELYRAVLGTSDNLISVTVTKSLTKAIDDLHQLFKLDIKLNELEGLMIFRSLSFCGDFRDRQQGRDLFRNKEQHIHKLLTQLQQNKFATLRFLNYHKQFCHSVRHLFKYISSWPFIFALDTAEFLAQDPTVAAAYHDDLLLFSGMINTQGSFYYHGSEDQEIAKKIVTVRDYLLKAAKLAKPNNLQYAVETILLAEESFSFEKFISVCETIDTLPNFDSKAVNEIMLAEGFTTSAKVPDVFTKDNVDLKSLIIELIILLDKVKTSKNTLTLLEEENACSSLSYWQLSGQSIAQLQTTLNQLWQESGALLKIVGQIQLQRILKNCKALSIKSAFGLTDPTGLLNILAEKIGALQDFNDHSDFEKINKISQMAEKIAQLGQQLTKNPFVVEQQQTINALFKTVDLSNVDYETVFAILSFFNAMPQRNYLVLLQLFFASETKLLGKKELVLRLLEHLTVLNNDCFPTEYLVSFSQHVMANPTEDFKPMINKLVSIHRRDNKDPILKLLMSHADFNYLQLNQLLTISENVNHAREQLSELFAYLSNTPQLKELLETVRDMEPVSRQQLLEILGKARTQDQSDVALNYSALAGLLSSLSAENLTLLHAFYETTPVSATCLYNALNKEIADDFQVFVAAFEKAPFGERNFESQFSCAAVERAINASKDLLNGSHYPYQYRKQLLEAFLFVNECGRDLPIYYNKPACELSNADIKSYFAALKANEIPGVTPFQRRLLALALMREAMYRSTGEFPYSTQIIALIDGILHQGDFISNIDTGQGKSLTDSMKAALLWLDSDRVDYTTSSMVDAKRDIVKYGPFLKSLDIPYSELPINSASPLEAFQCAGINFSTFPQLSLFFAKAKIMGTALETPDTVVSLVTNESDHAILDDRVIYRFATAENTGISAGQEWIYYAINEFVSRSEFIANHKTSAGEDIDDLKAYLKLKATALKKSGNMMNKIDDFTDEQCLNWLESSLMIHYVLKENKDYVIPDEFEKRVIHGTECHSRVVKLLMKDDKVSPDSTYGNGMHQLLYAYLNERRGSTDFIIEAQTKTIIASNNKNLLNYYLARKGFIWGSSGTVGSSAEIQEQYAKYGFDFSRAEPHQKNVVQYNEPIFEANEESQLKTLIKQLTTGNPAEHQAPSIVFCKDIETAKRFYQALEQQNPKQFPLQCYLGLGKEEDYIRDAAKPSMITITTSALGRNTDVHYNRIQGLRVWHTFVDSFRGTQQKSGRTGRQGSFGDVNFVLNTMELGGKTIDQIRAEIDTCGALERIINEALYDILGYFMAQLDNVPNEQFVRTKPAFLREIWSAFSAKIEERYMESLRDNSYNKDRIIRTALATFNHLIATELKSPMAEITFEAMKHAIEPEYPEKANYKPYTEDVVLKDCIAPITLAYHVLNFRDEENLDKAGIKYKLTQLLATITQDNFIDINRDYIHYLSATPVNQKLVVEAHKEFISDYLEQHAKKPNFIQRWLGYERKLNQTAGNPHYLLMFHAFASMSKQPVVEYVKIKELVHALLDDYLESSWFISSERKQWTLMLKDKINQAQDIDSIIQELSASQIQATTQDVTTSQNRSIKPLHFFGHSRYQTTLNRALNLVTAISGKTDVDPLLKGLAPALVGVTDQESMREYTADEFMHKASSPKRDKRMAQVILSNLKNAMEIKERQAPIGMLGRNSLFNAKPQKKNEQAFPQRDCLGVM